jgi:putative sterol carrier protein
MPEFPPSPVPPAEFMEDFLARAFAEADAFRASLGDLDTRLGVKLEGPAGGEWVVAVRGGEVSVAAEPRDDAAFTLVQSVEDWRGALWEGRGGAIGRQAASLFRPHEGLAASGPGAPPSPAALAQMRSLDGVIRVVVCGEVGGDWRVDFKLGPGAIPAQPSATLTFAAADAAALDQAAESERASLLLQLFMAGRIRVDGDMGLIMQMQAIQMQVQASGR